ncbi:hypothetical protein, partial [Sphingopyxis terrae]|uniref:hypothetical protein n=1 Tax=Sphingopyxis terrae TaxID=33052 RepID=UPI003F802981
MLVRSQTVATANAAAQTAADAAVSQNMVQDSQIAAIQTVNSVQDNRLMSLESMAGTALPVLQSLAATHRAQISDLYVIIDREPQRGTAAAVALVPAPMPSEPSKTSCIFNLATFRGEQAVGASIAHRSGTDNPFSRQACPMRAAGIRRRASALPANSNLAPAGGAGRRAPLLPPLRGAPTLKGDCHAGPRWQRLLDEGRAGR